MDNAEEDSEETERIEVEMQDTLDQVREFHASFGHPIRNTPYLLDDKLNNLRVSLLSEEVQELRDALAGHNKKEVLDALLDIQYVLDGAFLALGFWRAKHDAFAAVHKSNMSKLGQDGKPIVREDGKILKGPNYAPVQLDTFIKCLEIE